MAEISADLRVKETTPGVWLVYQPGQRPVEGVAVWQYQNGDIVCERHLYNGHTPVVCEHVRAVNR